jgi:hypothetical protein
MGKEGKRLATCWGQIPDRSGDGHGPDLINGAAGLTADPARNWSHCRRSNEVRSGRCLTPPRTECRRPCGSSHRTAEQCQIADVVFVEASPPFGPPSRSTCRLTTLPGGKCRGVGLAGGGVRDNPYITYPPPARYGALNSDRATARKFSFSFCPSN